jgi:pyruvate, orthophosphate dikinase
MASNKWVYDFAEGSRDMRALLGGKGANIAEMTRVLGLDRVPAGFTITTEACVEYMRAERQEPADMHNQVHSALTGLEEHSGKTLGHDHDPLLVSVRSGARDSMPGMMDTVLNLGLNDTSVEGLARTTGNERFAWDSYRRFTQMFGNVVRGIDGDEYEQAIKAVKATRGVKQDTELDVADLKELTSTFKRIYHEQTGEEFPQEPHQQLQLAINAVFDSWMGDRAVAYRRFNHIPDDWGTAVNIQQMVFGNKGDTSGSGVAFSRDEVTGGPEPSGDFLPNAQGEDVVSGARTPRDIAEMKDWMPELHADLMGILGTLESHYKNMQDTEFTVEEGRLYMLQTRNAKRPAQAATRFAVDAVGEGLLTREEALMTIDPAGLAALLHPAFDPKAHFDVLATGVNASPGAAKGAVVFTAHEAVEAAADGRDVILVRPFTDANDVSGFHAAKGILTSEGGKASHAALVARGMGRPAVVGVDALTIDVKSKTISVNGTVIHEGDKIAIDGTKGCVTIEDVPLVEAQVDANFETVLGWADDLRRLGIRANADTPDDAKRARSLGAAGIGLCRTEHMFMAEDRLPKMRAMIMANTLEDRKAALAQLLPLQQQDFEGLFEEMEGLPVTIRLLDPPLHEFLPNLAELSGQVEHARVTAKVDAALDQAAPPELQELETLLARVEEITEANPMLGTRGCRLGILYPEIYEMQVEAILRASKSASKPPHPEIMIPLVNYEHELELMRELVNRVGRSEGLIPGKDYTVGTMIELPRACTSSDTIARHADFFSFGTNDLTQTALGFSRDDAESKFVPVYLDRKIIDRSPFETIDEPGVGWLVRLAGWLGRESHPGLKLGVCGEHGGDPESIDFFHRAGLDYVSCSPFRVPIARIAAAQASIKHGTDSWS